MVSSVTQFRPGDQRAVSLLAGAGFGVDMQRRPIARLSLGQKARLGLLALRLTEPNFYLMDEPTNHVDIAGQERLEAEILAHEATCVIVSHDRAFVQAIAHAVPADRRRQDRGDRCAGCVLSDAGTADSAIASDSRRALDCLYHLLNKHREESHETQHGSHPDDPCRQPAAAAGAGRSAGEEGSEPAVRPCRIRPPGRPRRSPRSSRTRSRSASMSSATARPARSATRPTSRIASPASAASRSCRSRSATWRTIRISASA